MKKDTLLNKLIDEIDLIDEYAFLSGRVIHSVKFDKSLALHKTRAFKIIDLLRNL